MNKNTIRLFDVANVIRSKNSSPFEITLDILFEDESIYRKVRDGSLINKEIVASAFNCSVNEVLDIIYYDPARGIKINMPRKTKHASFGEVDMHGAQQHVPLQKIYLDI